MRLIDADAVNKHIDEYWDMQKRLGKPSKGMTAVMRTIKMIVNSLQKVDAVPVVRCKDCKWYYRGGATCMFWDGANSMCGDDYCSRAERKEE